MGAVTSKSPVERRNTVLRRSQRKSIHGVKGKADKLLKDIKKFKGTEEDAAYVELKARIDTLERDLKLSAKNLQPQIRNIYGDALKKTEDCYRLLDDKAAENADKIRKQQEAANRDEDDDVFEVNEEPQVEEEVADERQTVELKVIQVEPFEVSPQLNKRQSLLKMGVPVMPTAILEDRFRRTLDLQLNAEERLAEIRREMERVEVEISQFIGRKGGRHYNKFKEQLEGFTEALKMVPTDDEAIAEQVKMCNNYVNSCHSFLDDRAVGGQDSDVESIPEDVNDTPPDFLNGTGIAYYGELSPKTIRTTYI